MLIVCPSCASTYMADAERPVAAGRALGCATCRRARSTPPRAVSWMQNPALVGPQRRMAAIGDRLGRLFCAAVRPVPVAVALMATAMGLVAARHAVVENLPQTAALYARIGLPVNLRGLAFHNLHTELAGDGAQAVLVVAGEIVNVTSAAVAVPTLELSVRSPAGHPLYSWTAPPLRSTLGPGETLAFRTRLAAPPEEGDSIIVRFAGREAGVDVRTLAGGRLAEVASAR